jgi:kynurenine 3-monooxygenase
MIDESPPIAIVGGGLAGNLAAIMLARRGLRPTVYERAPAPDREHAQAGRTINLALAARGIAALEAAEVFSDIEALLLPMAGRIVHDAAGRTKHYPYGQKPNERIFSVSRSELNAELFRAASKIHAVSYHFDCECIAYDAAEGSLVFEKTDPASKGERLTVRSPLVLAADGAASVIRRRLAGAGLVEADEALLDHGYKELTIPAADGDFALDPEGLHIWPRGGFMLIALPNVDRSFTATLFLPNSGEPGFAELSAVSIRPFFAREFADVLALIPDLEKQFAENPVGLLGTITCHPWTHAHGNHVALLLGDAAHAVVPFHGQGLNAAFEDCLKLDELIATRGPDWHRIAPAFQESRAPNARAIAEMALENYREMRDQVRDTSYGRRRALEFELERRSGGKFVPRYAMVMFHPEIDYAEAARRGMIQADITARAMAGDHDDLELALAMIDERL